MLKHGLLVIVFVLLFRLLPAQNDTLSLYQIYYNFNDQEKSEWTRFMNWWSFDPYARIQKKAGLKHLSCKVCASLYADVYMELDAQGSVTQLTVLGGEACGKPLTEVLKTEFVNSLKDYKFTFLKQRRFRLRLGDVLKC